MLVDQSLHQRAMLTLQRPEDLAAIQAGIDDMVAGRVVAFEDVDARIRAKSNFPKKFTSERNAKPHALICDASRMVAKTAERVEFGEREHLPGRARATTDFMVHRTHANNGKILFMQGTLHSEFQAS